jgi:hypothetical protein
MRSETSGSWVSKSSPDKLALIFIFSLKSTVVGAIGAAMRFKFSIHLENPS